MSSGAASAIDLPLSLATVSMVECGETIRASTCGCRNDASAMMRSRARPVTSLSM
jgi:hypothetical protein